MSIKLSDLTLESVPIQDLKLDTKNARFAHISNSLSQEKIKDQIWSEGDTKILYKQILAASGIYDELIIDTNDVVKEGNRRLVCLLQLQKELKGGMHHGLDKNLFNKIVCKRLPRNASKKDIDLFLAVIHVRGKKKWNAFSKAKFMHDLYHVDKLDEKKILDNLNVGPKVLLRMIDAYITTKGYGEIAGDEKWHEKFTYFDELFRRRDLAEFRKNKDNIKKFQKWVKEKKFTDVRQVRIFHRILRNSEAYQRFKLNGMPEAIKFLEPIDPALTSTEFNRVEKFTEFIRTFPNSELTKTARDNKRLERLKDLQKELESFVKKIELTKKTIKRIPQGM